MQIGKKVILFGLFIVISIMGWVFFSISLKDITYYYTVSEILAEPKKFAGKDIRVMGLVQTGSVEWNSENMSLSFRITEDGINFLPIKFNGTKPDLFKENQGVVAEGQFDQAFKAHNLLVKHSPEYRVRDHQSAKEKYYQSLIR